MTPQLLPCPAVAVCATCPEPAAILAELRAPGRLDHVVRVPAPGPAERISMMAAGLLAAGATFDIKDLKVSRSASAASGQVKPACPLTVLLFH